jgi:transposase
MSLQIETEYAVPTETAQVARAAFPKGNLYLLLRDELGVFLSDETFAALFSPRGQPAEAPWRLVLVCILQFMEGLSDRQAAEAVRARIDWKYLLGLALTDAGFDASILTEFRARLIEGQLEYTLLDHLLTVCKSKGWVKARGQQRTDSTHVLAAVRDLNRLECVGETMRCVLNHLAESAPDWLATVLTSAWKDRYGLRFSDYCLPKDKTEREKLAEQIGADGVTLLQAASAASAPEGVQKHPAVALLRQVWEQQYYGLDQPVRWRKEEDLPPSMEKIRSPYDAEARYGLKRMTGWMGYKVHVTETCDEGQPHLITHVETTTAPVGDFDLPPTIHAALAKKDLLPKTHLVDAGYMDAGNLVASRDEYQVELLGPISAGGSWQQQAAQGYDSPAFQVDWETQIVTCPQGQHNLYWCASHDRRHNPIVKVTFSALNCNACEQRPKCTTSTHGRSLTLRPRAQHEALQQAREQQTTDAFKTRYRARAGIEGRLSQGVRACDLRRSRYIGLAKTHLQHVLTAAALNLKRVAAWIAGEPLARTRTAPFITGPLATP